MSHRSRFVSGFVTCASLSMACGAGAPGASFGPTRAGPPLSNTAPTASLSGTWIGSRPGDGMVIDFAGCGTCGGTPSSSAGDVVLNVSDSNHALSGSATWKVRDAPPAVCPAEPDCTLGPVGEVVTVSVTGTVGAGGRVAMRWDGTVVEGRAPFLFILEGTVIANRMSGTVLLTGGDVPGGSASGIWSVNLQ